MLCRCMIWSVVLLQGTARLESLFVVFLCVFSHLFQAGLKKKECVCVSGGWLGGIIQYNTVFLLYVCMQK